MPNKKHFNIQDIFSYIQDILFKILKTEFNISISLENVFVEIPKNKSHGDFYTNAALVLSKELKMNPNELANKIKILLLNEEFIEKVDIAGPGFINITVKNYLWLDFVQSVLKNPDEFGYRKLVNKEKILIEFVSANPTGPMHVGHCRGAIFGDALANLYKACGFDVTKEYYINDAGSQINILVRSLFVRYQQLFNVDVNIADSMYPGHYLIDIAQDLKAEYQNKLLNKNFDQIFPILRKFAIDKIMLLIKQDLKLLNVTHSSFVSEQDDINEKGFILKAIDVLKSKSLIYEGFLAIPKGVDAENWQPESQTIFASTNFGDDVDRSVQRADKTYTYLAGDLGLAMQRIERGYSNVVLILGADHTGFVKRIKAVTQALSDGKSKIDLPLVQMVNLLKNGTPFKMSKRSGDFIRANDVINEVGVDILRFILLSRRTDTIIDFDFEKVTEKTKDNPVFYVQYAHARCNSILRNAKNNFNITPNLDSIYTIKTDHEILLIKIIATLPKVVEQAMKNIEPHRLINFLIELVTEFHSFWSKGSSNEDLRFIIPHDRTLTEGRLILVELMKITIRTTLGLLGIEAIEKM